MRKVLICCSLAFALSAAPAKAQEPTLLGEFSDWAAYTYTSQQGKVCYAVSIPKSSDPEGINRDPVFFLITHFPQQGVRNEVSTIIGYPFRKESLAELTIGEPTFEFFTSGDGAWADSSAKDDQIVAALKKGSRMDLGNLLAGHLYPRQLFPAGGIGSHGQDRSNLQPGAVMQPFV